MYDAFLLTLLLRVTLNRRHSHHCLLYVFRGKAVFDNCIFFYLLQYFLLCPTYDVTNRVNEELLLTAVFQFFPCKYLR